MIQQELWCWWDAYKVGLESSQSPDMMLILEKWQELKFVKPEDFAALVWVKYQRFRLKVVKD